MLDLAFEGAAKFSQRVIDAHLAHARLASTYVITGGTRAGRKDFAHVLAAAGVSQVTLSAMLDRRLDLERIVTSGHPDIHIFGNDDEKSIKIEQAREMLRGAGLKPFSAARKIFLLLEAQRLTVEASNALLKTLEEAPAATLFLLTTESRSQLLETIQSRCFELRLQLLSREFEVPQFHLEGRLPGIGGAWEDFFETAVTLERPERNQFFQDLLFYCRNRMKMSAQESGDWRPVEFWLRCFNDVYETFEGLEANVGVKLAMTRAAMQLRKHEE